MTSADGSTSVVETLTERKPSHSTTSKVVSPTRCESGPMTGTSVGASRSCGQYGSRSAAGTRYAVSVTGSAHRAGVKPSSTSPLTEVVILPAPISVDDEFHDLDPVAVHRPPSGRRPVPST
jgi:hypothetical protein